MAETVRRRMLACVAVLGAVVMFAQGSPAPAQTVQDSLREKQEATRRLEREIGELESRLAAAQQDSVSVAVRLSEIEKNVMACMVEMDRVASEVEACRKALNDSVKAMYVRGRDATLIKLISSSDVADFLAWYENMLIVARSESLAFKNVKERRKRLRDLEGRLAAFKREQAALSRTADTSAIEQSIEEKKSELAVLAGELIAQQVPGTYVPAPTSFVPARVYARPDPNAFMQTGQIFSGYATWYGSSSEGRPTASGETFDDLAFTCSHSTLPFGTWLKVTFRDRSVIVKVNDRLTLRPGDRLVELSGAAAETVGLTGTHWVDCEIVVPRP